MPVTSDWTTVPVSAVRVGDVVRTQHGHVVTVTRIEAAFLGRPEMIAFIEDTPERWFKCPQPAAGQIEVQSTGG